MPSRVVPPIRCAIVGLCKRFHGYFACETFIGERESESEILTARFSVLALASPRIIRYLCDAYIILMFDLILSGVVCLQCSQRFCAHGGFVMLLLLLT